MYELRIGIAEYLYRIHGYLEDRMIYVDTLPIDDIEAGFWFGFSVIAFFILLQFAGSFFMERMFRNRKKKEVEILLSDNQMDEIRQCIKSDYNVDTLSDDAIVDVVLFRYWSDHCQYDEHGNLILKNRFYNT